MAAVRAYAAALRDVKTNADARIALAYEPDVREKFAKPVRGLVVCARAVIAFIAQTQFDCLMARWVGHRARLSRFGAAGPLARILFSHRAHSCLRQRRTRLA